MCVPLLILALAQAQTPTSVPGLLTDVAHNTSLQPIGAAEATPYVRAYRPPVAGTGSSFAAHRPLLKSVNSTWPFHGIAFMTNGAFAV